MFLVLDRDAELHVYASASDAEHDLEAIDVENAEYEFCDDTGQKFLAEITSQVTTFCAGTFRLRSEGSPDTAFLSSLLSRARALGTSCGDITSLEALRSRVARREI